ncbi:MAG: hypothetical protein IMZ64_12945 [Bacteroidetes bacterium]|nr:hypothetical protein [Bacteroidota bacterium]
MEKEAADKRLRLRTETKLIKAIARIFPEPRTPQDPAAIMRALAKGYELTIMDEARIRAIRPNNQEGQRILSRFYTPEKEIAFKPVKFLDVKFAPCNYGADVLIEILKIFDCFTGPEGSGKEIVIEVRENSPMVLRNDYFTMFMAPRITDQKEAKNAVPADYVL